LNKEAIDYLITQLTKVLKQFLVCGLKEPLICAWKDEIYTDYYAALNEKEYTTPPPVLCSIAS
jgi:hypothetical protein